MARYLFVAALVAVFAPFLAQAQLAEGCTTNSFTTPSWLIDGLRSQADNSSTVVSFHALNRATNASIQVRCLSAPTNATAEWKDCSAGNQTGSYPALKVAFQADKTTAQFRFNETWSCSDANPAAPTKFIAVGNGSLPISCATDQTGTQSCKSSTPLLIKASLLSPIQITPAYARGPQGHDTKGCSADSKTPSWAVTAAQLNLGKVGGNLQSGNAFIIIRNNVLGYSASCGGTLTGATGGQVLSCSPQTVVQRQSKYQIQTVVLFDPKTFAVTVNQTWFCDDEDSAKPVSLSASGSTTLTVECTDFSAETTFCSGSAEEAGFKGSLTSQSSLPPYVLKDPLSTAESCTIYSIVSPAWRLSDFETTAPTANTTVGTLRFGLELNAGEPPTGYPSTIANKGVQLPSPSSAESGWYPCMFESIGEPALAPTNCSFRYDMTTKAFGLDVEWVCNDLDAANAVAFSGQVRTATPDLTCVTEGPIIRCASPSVKTWNVNATSVVWR